MLITEFTKPADRKDIDSALQPFLDFIKSGEEIPIKKIRNKLYRALKPIGIDEIDILRSKNVDVGDMNMNGAYDPHDDEDEFPHFSLELIFSETDETIAFSKEGVENIKDRLIDLLEHEMIHRNQYRGRSFKKQRSYEPAKGISNKLKRTREYLGNDDEIEAFAKNISSELIRKVDKDGALKLLRMAGKTANFKDEMNNLLSPNLFGYMAAFDFDTSHPVLKKLLKKIWLYIEHSDG
tara:strand:+ start:72 stop:782 length:711 start_codon:yes stop_codon:yes gene_type:complete